MPDPDLIVENHSSVLLVRAVSLAGEELLDQFIESPEHQFFGNALVVEPRFIEGFVEQLIEDGYTVA